MKILFLTLILLSAKTYASGCDHDMVFLTEEKVIQTYSDKLDGNFYCIPANECVLFVYSQDPTDSGYGGLYFKFLGKTDNQKERVFRNVTLKQYSQNYTGPCGDTSRTMLGVDIGDMRFRTEKDLDYL
jgi:hypothetical protein